MSDRRTHRRRKQKQFVQQEEQEEQPQIYSSQIGQKSIVLKNKLSEKRQDQFDSNKIQPNFFVNIEPQVQKTKYGQNIVQKVQGYDQTDRNKKARGKRRARQQKQQKKYVQQQQLHKNGQDFRTSKNNQLFVSFNNSQNARQQKQQIEEVHLNQKSSSQNEDNVMQMMKNMALKKQEQKSKPSSTYIMMHLLINAKTQIEQKKKVMYHPLQFGQSSFVYFRRQINGFAQYYQLLGQDQRTILFCQNQRGCIGCNYYISLTKQMDKNSQSYLGKLRGNASGSTYYLYDHGSQPNSKEQKSKLRATMAIVQYESNFLGKFGPRIFKATTPNPIIEGDFDSFRFSQNQDFNKSQLPRKVFRNKQPKWSEKLKSYALNFGGRVKQPSIKNFILIDDQITAEEEEEAPNIITFGKIDESTFCLQFRHPLSMYQAFGIAMSEFDFKLKCQ